MSDRNIKTKETMKKIREKNVSSGRIEVIKILIGAIFTGLTFYTIFFMNSIELSENHYVSLIRNIEILKLSLGLSFFYSFVCVLNYNKKKFDKNPKQKPLFENWKNLTESYAIFLASLFFVKTLSFAMNNILLILSYIVALVMLMFTDAFVRKILSGNQPIEGKKRLVIVDSNKQSENIIEEVKTPAPNVFNRLNDNKVKETEQLAAK